MRKLILPTIIIFCAVTANAQFEVTDYITFESPDSLLKIDTSLTENIWQIGRPQKTFFDSASSVPNAIVTDTVNFYPPNNFSTFTIKICDPAWSQNEEFTRTFIEFRHKFDTDSLQDGGYIEVSYDSGSNWTNVADDPSVIYFTQGFSGYTGTVYNGNKAFTGRSEGWLPVGFGWCYMQVLEHPSTLYLRFVFVSDSIQTNKEGWMIDDIYLFTDICEGIEEVENDLISIFPNPVDNELIISRKKKTPEEEIQIFDFTGRLIIANKHLKEESVNTSMLRDGVYLLKYSNERQFSLKKFMVQH